MKVVIYFLCAAALAAMAVNFDAPNAADALLFAFVIAVLSIIAAVAWRSTRRRERQRIEDMRDSALW
jgi:membrane protein implicated in regulation of membrane protease activity